MKKHSTDAKIIFETSYLFLFVLEFGSHTSFHRPIWSGLVWIRNFLPANLVFVFYQAMHLKHSLWHSVIMGWSRCRQRVCSEQKYIFVRQQQIWRSWNWISSWMVLKRRTVSSDPHYNYWKHNEANQYANVWSLLDRATALWWILIIV